MNMLEHIALDAAEEACSHSMDGNPKIWQAVVRAVRNAVIEECAKMCDDVANEVWHNTRSEHWSDEFELLAHNMRSLKK